MDTIFQTVSKNLIISGGIQPKNKGFKISKAFVAAIFLMDKTGSPGMIRTQKYSL